MALRVCTAIVLVNWMIWGALVIAVGGSALCGEISDGEYLICRHSTSSGVVPVSSAFWIFSLSYGSVTIGLSPLALALVFVLSRPRWARGYLDIAALALGFLWLLGITTQAVPRWFAWVAA